MAKIFVLFLGVFLSTCSSSTLAARAPNTQFIATTITDGKTTVLDDTQKLTEVVELPISDSLKGVGWKCLIKGSKKLDDNQVGQGIQCINSSGPLVSIFAHCNSDISNTNVATMMLDDQDEGVSSTILTIGCKTVGGGVGI